MSNRINNLRVVLAVSAAFFASAATIADAASPVLSQSAWTLHSVSSQELLRENGAAINAFDGDAATFWHTQWDESSLPHQISVDLGADYVLEAFRYRPRPYAGNKWQTNGRISEYEFFVSDDGIEWGSAVASGTLANVAEEQEVTFPQASGRYVRLVALTEVNAHPRYTSMAELNLRGIPLTGNYPPTAVDDSFTVAADSGDNSLAVLSNDTDPDLPQDSLVIASVSASTQGATLSHDGSNVFYRPPAGFSGMDEFSYVVRDGAGDTDSATVTVQVGAIPALLPRSSWSIVFVDSEELVRENGAALNALDGDPETFWHTDWYEGAIPHELVIDLGARYSLAGFRYLPRPYYGKTWQTNGRIKDYEIYVSEDASSWGSPVASGMLANTAAEKEVVFESRRSGRYVKLIALSEVNGHPRYTSMAEFNLLGLSASGNTPPIAVDDSFAVAGDSSDNLLPVLENDLDIDPADSLTIASIGASLRGATMSHDGTQVRYAPPAGFSGTDSFSYVVRDGAGATDSASVTVQVGATGTPVLLSRAAWRIASVSSEELVRENGAAINILDGNPDTIWHTEWFGDNLPHELVVDLGATHTLHAFRYLPRPYMGQTWQTNGRVKDYAFYVSDSVDDWGTPAATGTLANTELEKEVVLSVPKIGRYVRFVALSEVNGHPRYASMAEFNLVGLDENGGPIAPPTSGTHYWRLDETTGTSFADQVGGLSGNCSNCPVAAPGAIDGGQDFSSGAAGITVPAAASLNWYGDQDFSIEAWVRTADCGAAQAFVGRTDLAAGAHWSLGCNNRVARFEADDGLGQGPRVLQGGRTLADDRWHHVAIVRDADAGELRLYIDGVQDGRIEAGWPQGLPLSDVPLTIGFRADPNGEQRFTGRLDEIAIRARALSAAQIDRHFNDGSAGLALGYDTCAASPIRIMPLGDSNTGRVGYRRPLSLAMLSEGYVTDFVGSKSDSCASPCPYDPDHEGHGGWTPAEIAAALPNWLARTPPEVVLLHIGTNQLDVAGVVDILDIIKQHDPEIVVLLARIINRQTYHPATTAFNDEVAAIAASRIAAGDKIRIVDHESALNYPDDMSDLVHPNSTGFGKMKDVWLRDLRRFLPACSSAPPAFVSQPDLQAIVGEPYQYHAVASGVPAATYSLLEAPEGIKLHPDTGRLDWATPVSGSHAIRIRAENSLGNVTQAYTLEVN